MLKMLKWILGIFSFLIGAVVIGVIIFIMNFDLNEYKPQIEKLVYEQTGRKLELKGDIGIKISLVPTLETKDVVFENASWAGKSPMIQIKEADVTLGILPLLRKHIEIEEINIIEPVVNLSVNAEGQGNWAFTKPSEEKEDAQKEGVQKEEAKKESSSTEPLLAGFVAKKLYIENGVVSYQDLKSKSKTNLKIKSLELASENMDSQVDLKYDIEFNKEKIQGNLKADSINALLANEPYKVLLSAKAFGANLKANALLKNLTDDLSFEVSTDILSPNGNFGLSKTELQADVKGNLKLINVLISKLDLGGNILNGNLSLNLEGKKPSISGKIESPEINVKKITAQEKNAQISLVKTAHAASFVPNEKLDLSVLNDLNANVNVDLKKLILNEDMALQNVNGTINVQKGVLAVNPLNFTAGGGQVSGNVSIAATDNVLTLNLDGKNIVIQNFLKSLDPKNDATFGFKSGGDTTLHVVLKSNGATYQNLVENLDGQTIIVVGKSQLQAGALKYLKGGFISQLLSALKLEAKDPKMSLKCAVLRADFKDGKAKFPKGIVFDSKKMMVVGDGNVNLKNDKISISIKPFNGNLTDTNIAQAISSLVKVSGTVSSPSVAIDTASVVKNVVGVAMTGPAFIGSQLLLDADQAPCYTALKETVYKDMFEAPTGVKAGAQNVYQGTSDIVEGSINLLTGAAGSVAEGGADLIGETAKGVLNLLSNKKKKEDKAE